MKQYFVSALWALICCTSARADDLPPHLTPNPATEAWVQQMISTGEVAHLEDKFKSERDRVLSAAFLDNLMRYQPQHGEVPRKRIWIVGAIFAEPIDMENAEIVYEVRLHECLFIRTVDLRNATFHQQVEFDGSTFREPADFTGLKVKALYFRGSTFADSVDFRSATVATDFDASKAQFTSGKPVELADMKIGGSAFFRGAAFSGSTNFRNTHIREGFYAEDARFAGEVCFARMRVEGVANFHKAVFAGPADFTGARFGELLMKEAAFVNAEPLVDFGGLVVRQSAHLEGSVFYGRVAFSHSRIGSALVLDDAKFNFSLHSVDFLGMEVGEAAYFIHTHFAGPVHVQYARVPYLQFIGSDDGSSRYHRLNLSGCTIIHELVLENISLDQLLARSLHVDGAARIKRIAILDKADLQQAHFGFLELTKVTWPAAPNAIQLNEMTYRQMSGGDDQASWRTLLSLINRSAWSASAYTNLETVLRREGYPSRADEVFIAMKERERSELLQEPSWWWNLPDWLKNYGLGWLVSHGKNPQHAFYWSGFFIVVGYFVFRRAKMQPVGSYRATGSYSALVYSFEQFLPVTLGEAARWTPRDDCPCVHAYAKVHRFLGWFLIPIGLAAFTGIIGKS